MPNQPQLTIKIVDRGTLVYSQEQGKYVPSQTGHMWYEITNADGVINSYGFSPVTEGSPLGPGDVNPHGADNEIYQTDFSNEGGDYQRSFTITQQQYETLKFFGDRGYEKEFVTSYNGLKNNCIDFTYKALELIDFVPEGYDGDAWPTWNINNIRALPSTNPLDTQLFISEEGGLFLLDDTQQMTVRLFTPIEQVNQSKIANIASTSVELGAQNIVIEGDQTNSNINLTIQNADELTKIKTNPNIDLSEEGDLQFADNSGNALTRSDAVIDITTSNNDNGSNEEIGYIAIRTDTQVKLKEDGFTPLSSLIAMGKSAAKFTEEFVANYIDNFKDDFTSAKINKIKKNHLILKRKLSIINRNRVYEMFLGEKSSPKKLEETPKLKIRSFI